MGLDVRVEGRKGEPLDLLSDGRVGAGVLPVPPGDWTAAQVAQKKVLVGFLLNGQTADMTIDGSTDAKDFELGASAGQICWVSEIRITMHDSQMKLDSNEVRRFGSSAASPGLTNGVRLFAEQGGTVTEIFTSGGVKSVSDFYRYSDTVQGITDGVSAGVDIVNVRVLLPVPVGLFPGSTDRLVIQVQDDLTTMTLFETQYLGWVETL